MDNKGEQPIARLTRTLGAPKSRERQYGRNSCNLLVLSTSETEVKENGGDPPIATDNDVIADSINSLEKDLDEISDASLENDDEIFNDKWENISDGSFEEMIEIDNDGSPAGQSNYAEFTVGYRQSVVKYLPNVKNIGFFKPKVYAMSPNPKLVVCYKQESEIPDHEAVECEENVESFPSKIDTNDESADSNSTVLVTDNSEELPDSCHEIDLEMIEVKHVDETEPVEEVTNKDEPSESLEEDSCVDQPEVEIIPTSTASPEEIVECKEDAPLKESDVKDNKGYHQGKLLIQDSIDIPTKLLGLEYIVEIWETQDEKLHSYSCWLCNEENLEKNSVLDHIENTKHKLKYIHKHFPSASENFPMEEAVSDSSKAELNAFCETLPIDKKKSLPFVTTVSYVESNRDILRTAIENAHHSGEVSDTSSSGEPIITIDKSLSPEPVVQVPKKRHIQAMKQMFRKTHKPLCPKKIEPPISVIEMEDVSLDSVLSLISESGKDSDTKNKNIEGTVDKADAQIGMADRGASDKKYRFRTLSPLSIDKSPSPRPSTYSSRSIRYESRHSSRDSRPDSESFRHRSPDYRYPRKRFESDPWFKPRPSRGIERRFRGYDKRDHSKYNHGTSKKYSRSPPRHSSSSKGLWRRSRSPVRERYPLSPRRYPPSYSRGSHAVASSSGRSWNSRKRSRSRSLSPPRYRHDRYRHHKSKSPRSPIRHHRKRSRSTSRKRSLSRSKYSRSISRSPVRSTSRSRSSDRSPLFRDKRSSSSEPLSHASDIMDGELKRNLLQSNSLINESLFISDTPLWSPPINIGSQQVFSSMLYTQPSSNIPSNAFTSTFYPADQRNMMPGAMNTYSNPQVFTSSYPVSVSVAPPAPVQHLVPVPSAAPVRHLISVPTSPIRFCPPPPPAYSRPQISVSKPSPVKKVPPSNFDIAEGIYKKFENSAQVSKLDSSHVFTDMRSTLHKIFGTSSDGGSQSRQGSVEIPGLGDFSSEEASSSQGKALHSKHILVKAVEHVKNTLGESSISDERLESAVLNLLKKKLHKSEGKSDSIQVKGSFIPPHTKVQFRENSNRASSSNIFPVLPSQSKPKIESSTSQDQPKAVLAQRLASVLIKLGMLDVSASRLADMLHTIGVFNSSLPLQDIKEEQIINVLRRCNYI